MTAWEWPQWVFVVYTAISVAGAPLLHGKPRTNWSGFVIIFNAALNMFILYMGGFFS